MKAILIAIALATVGVAVSSASASLVPVGDAQESNSWTQVFNEGYGTFDFDRLEVHWTAGSLFETPVFMGFSNGDWTVQTLDATSTSDLTDATGAIAIAAEATNKVSFTLHFEGDLGSSTEFIFDAFNGELLVDHATATYDGSKWTVDPLDLAPATPVPLPASAGVGLCMLAGFGIMCGIGRLLRNRTRIA